VLLQVFDDDAGLGDGPAPVDQRGHLRGRGDGVEHRPIGRVAQVHHALVQGHAEHAGGNQYLLATGRQRVGVQDRQCHGNSRESVWAEYAHRRPRMH